MINYFKYSDGEAFTLDGSDYKGFFNVYQEKAYTGKSYSENESILTPKNNFLSEFFINKGEFDTSYDNIESISPYYSNAFDLLNKQELDNVFDRLNKNNLVVFKNLVIQYPKVFNIEKSDFHFYGLSSTNVDNRDDDIIYGKTTYTQIDPFSFSQEWEYLDNIKKGSFIVDSNDNFLYYAMESQDDTTIQRVLSGNFSNTTPLALLDSRETIAVNYHFDDNNHNLYIINQDSVEVFDTSNYPTCQNFILTDIIPISASRIPYYKWNTTFETWDDIAIKWDFQYQAPNTDTIPKFIRIGNNVRVELSLDKIYLLNKNSREIYSEFLLKDLGIGSVQSLDIRSVDDAVLILHRKDDLSYITFFDSFNVNNSLKETKIFDLSIDDNINLYFSSTDSNLFYISNRNTVQLRAISNPTYATSKIDPTDLLYLKDYFWDLTKERWEYFQIKWDSNNQPSNSFNNILTDVKIYNNSLYILIHNLGRIYTIKHPLNLQYLNSVPLDLEKSYQGLTCSDSSIGLYINNSLISITKDILSLYSKAKYQFRFGNGYPVLDNIKELEFATHNLYLNGNETINVIALQRILSLITDIQSQLLSTQD